MDGLRPRVHPEEERPMMKQRESSPDVGPKEIEAAMHRLEDAAPWLQGIPGAERAERLGRLLDHLCDPQSHWRQALIERTVATSGFSRENVAAGLELALEDWDSTSLANMVRRELTDSALQTGGSVIGPAMTSVVLAGVIPMPNLLNTILPLLVGSPVLVKPSPRDPGTPVLVVECLKEIDPELARCIEVVPFRSHDSPALNRFLRSPCVMASGSDETILAIRRQMSPHQRLIAYGHKFSVAVVESSSLLDVEWREEVAEALAIDIALWDQLGCLSPAAIYVLGREAGKARLALLETLSRKLAERTQLWPRGEATDQTRADIKRARDEAEMRAGLPDGPELASSPDSDWTVIAESSPAWRATPLHRFVRLYPVEDHAALYAELEPMGPHLSSAALAGAGPDWDPTGRLAAELRALGFSRFCRPGQLQAPSIHWHHDGRPVLEPLLALPVPISSH